MFTGMELMACRNLAVPIEVMQHVVHVESSSNPYAIGVVGGQLVRQPQNMREALATVQMLDAKGYNYSLGVAQVNRANLGKYGLDSYEKAFETCPNLSAGARILAACYASSGRDWGKSFSCYYSGNFVTGYRDGYVQKIYDSINSGAIATASRSQVIPLQTRPSALYGMKGISAMTSDSSSYRVAIRSVILDAAMSAAAPAIGRTLDTDSSATASAQPQPSVSVPTVPPAPDTAPVSSAAVTPASTANAPAVSVFVPQVRGPNDASSISAPAASTTSQPQIDGVANSTGQIADHTDLRQESRDAAFVF